MTFTRLIVTKALQNSLLNWMREIRWAPTADAGSLGPLQDTSWLELFWGYVMFMIRRRSRPSCTIMSGFGFRMTLHWSSQLLLSRRCSELGSVLLMPSCGQVLRSLGPDACPRSSLFARLVRVLTVLALMGAFTCR